MTERDTQKIINLVAGIDAAVYMASATLDGISNPPHGWTVLSRTMWYLEWATLAAEYLDSILKKQGKKYEKTSKK